MRRQELELSAFTCDAAPPAGKEAAEVLLCNFPDTTAVIIQNELAATGFVNRLQRGDRYSG